MTLRNNNFNIVSLNKKNYKWYDFLCEYYNVTPSQALELGTRRSGRKPNLPGSKTCQPVSDLNYEQIWALKERKTPEDIFSFYRDQGAWSTFRQEVRHLELKNFHRNVLNSIIRRPNMHFCEYGCGVAPYASTLLLECPQDFKIDISISDVAGCEHLYFAEWKLNKIVEGRGLKNVTIKTVPVEPTGLPTYHKPIDALLIFEVLEHVLSPVDTLNNITEQMNSQAIFVENFIKHEHDDDEDDGPDLESAANERSEYYEMLDEQFRLVGGNPEPADPNGTRFWIKNN